MSATRGIDAHQHFWRFSSAEYGWIETAGLTELRRDFLPADLMPLLDAQGIDGTVAVQARQTVGETEWLLSLAQLSERIQGVVGWLDLSQDSSLIDAQIMQFDGRAGGLVGLRHVIQDEPDGFMDSGQFRRGVARLAAHGLAYDLLIFERQLPEALRFVDALPADLAVVLDHIGKPDIASSSFEGWREGLAELSRRANVSVKLSGLVTEAAHGSWTAEQLERYMDAVLETFGPQRIMFGSDWPVCTLAASYGRWFEVASSWADKLGAAERTLLFGGTATRVYRLEDGRGGR